MIREDKTNETINKVFNCAELDFMSLDEILAQKWVSDDENIVKYPLRTGVTLTIIDNDDDYDFGSLNMFGVSINMTFRDTKKGVVAFYPSYKKSVNKYGNYVTSYSKVLNDVVKSVVYAHYN